MSQNYGSIALHKLLKDHFNIDEFIAGQEDAITNILSGENVLAVFPQKKNRPICYKLPAIILDGITIVVSRYMNEPTVDLLPTTYLNASLENEIFQKRIYEIIDGKYKLVYISPEQIRNRTFLFALKKIPLSLLVIDDAEQMSRYGYNFNSNYKYILNAISDLDSQPRFLVLAGIYTEKIRSDIIKAFNLESMKIIIPELSYPDIFLSVIPATSEMEKLDKLSALISELKGYGIIFVNSRNTARNVLRRLKNIEPAISIYYGGMSREEQKEIRDDFNNQKIKTLIIASYSNIKIEPDVDYVIYFYMPDCLDRYYNHIFLSGQFSRCILIYSPLDRNFHHSLIETGSTLRNDIWRVIDMLKRNDKNITEKKIKEKTFDIDDWLYEHLKRLDRPSKKELI
ncbi:MAG: helicase-related protein, partial [Candidatus Poribacteria bacterium]